MFDFFGILINPSIFRCLTLWSFNKGFCFEYARFTSLAFFFLASLNRQKKKKKCDQLNTDTRIMRTLRHVPLVSVLTGFHCKLLHLLSAYWCFESLFQRKVRIVNSAGETPKDVARRFGRLGCIAILGGDSGTVVWLRCVILGPNLELKFLCEILDDLFSCRFVYWFIYLLPILFF